MALLTIPLLAITLSSCKDDNDGWTYFKNQKEIDFEYAVGQIVYSEKDKCYAFQYDRAFIQPIPVGGDEAGVIYLIRECQVDLKQYEKKKCVVSGTYRKIKEYIFSDGLGSKTYCDMNIKDIAEYFGEKAISRAAMNPEDLNCGTIALEIPDTIFLNQFSRSVDYSVGIKSVFSNT